MSVRQKLRERIRAYQIKLKEAVDAKDTAMVADCVIRIDELKKIITAL